MHLLRLITPVLGGLALLVAACSNTSAEPSPDGPVPTVITSDNSIPGDPASGGISPATPDEPPAGTFEVGGVEYELGLGSYCWSPPANSPQPAICADAIGYITPIDPAIIAPGDVIQVTGGLMMPPIEITSARLWAVSEPFHGGDDFLAWHPDGEGVALTVIDGRITLPAVMEPGRHLLVIDIISIDPSSSASYSAILEVD